MQQSQQLSRKTLPHVVCCRIWRWADLQNCNELKSVQHCQHAYNHHAATSLSQTASSGKKATDSDNSPLVCINPYHYIRCDSNQSTMQQQQAASTNLLTVYVPLASTASHMSSQMSTNELSPIAEDEATNSTSSSTASTPVSYSHSPNGSGSQQHAMPTQISSSSSTSSSSSLQNELVMPQLLAATASVNTTAASSTTDLIHSSNFMMSASPSEPVMFTSDSSSILPGPGMLGCFLRSHSPDSPLASAHMNMNGCLNMNMSSQSPISASPAFNNAMQQFSPFISEDDSSEINDISPSPIGTCGKLIFFLLATTTSFLTMRTFVFIFQFILKMFIKRGILENGSGEFAHKTKRIPYLKKNQFCCPLKRSLKIQKTNFLSFNVQNKPQKNFI